MFQNFMRFCPTHRDKWRFYEFEQISQLESRRLILLESTLMSCHYSNSTDAWAPLEMCDPIALIGQKRKNCEFVSLVPRCAACLFVEAHRYGQILYSSVNLDLQ
jgi:hypothetical protein